MKSHQLSKNNQPSYKILIDSGLWSCETNLVSCSRIYRYLIENGHGITFDASQADFIIINTCGVVKGIVDRCLTLFYTYSSLKKKEATIIMFGCLVKIDRELFSSLDVLLIGPDEGHRLDEYFSTKSTFETITPYCDDNTKQLLFHEQKPFRFVENAFFFVPKILLPLSKNVRHNYQRYLKNVTQTDRVFIEISRGCVGDCSYCTIKKAKGKLLSRKTEEIISDIRRVNDPSKNIFLVADDCGCFGIDFGGNIFNLLYEINKEFSNQKIDLNNLNPQWIEKQSNEYITLFQKVPIDLVKIPIQSGSNKIIKKMNRHYEINTVLRTIDNIKNSAPNIFIYTQCIVGYPGENTIDFLKTLIAARHFDYAIPFRYSKNKGTVSASLPKQKLKWITFSRYIFFIFFINFVITIKLFTHSTLEMKSKVGV
jgi:tRNA A37 methylthiotransferase MiaB